MPPLPTGNIPVTQSSDVHEDLTGLRKKWSEQFRDIDSLPTPSNTIPIAPARRSSPIPDLPLLGSEAHKVAMSLDDLDTFLSNYHSEDTAESPPSAATSSAQLPEIPFFPMPASATPVKREPLPEFPHASVPDVSLPQVRESITRTERTTPPAPDLNKLRQTAPQYVKFSPDTEEATEKETSQPKPEAPGYTDQDLREALQPIINPVVDQFLYKPSQGIHTFLEPMLRSTVRRAIAEQMEDATPFREVSGWDKFAWKLRAMFSSRTYDDVIFDFTRRYQVEEIYLLRPRTRSLISYASHDPARHAKPDKIQDTVKKIAAKESCHKDEDSPIIKWRDTRNLMIRRGKHCLLAAIVNGPSNAILRADLDYALRQAEERFGEALKEETDIHMQVLQPLLEGCLLIQSPAIPN